VTVILGDLDNRGNSIIRIIYFSDNVHWNRAQESLLQGSTWRKGLAELRGVY